MCGEFTGDRWIPRTNGQLRGKCFHLMTSSWWARLDISWLFRGRQLSYCGRHLLSCGRHLNISTSRDNKINNWSEWVHKVMNKLRRNVWTREIPLIHRTHIHKLYHYIHYYINIQINFHKLMYANMEFMIDHILDSCYSPQPQPTHPLPNTHPPTHPFTQPSPSISIATKIKMQYQTRLCAERDKVFHIAALTQAEICYRISHSYPP